MIAGDPAGWARSARPAAPRRIFDIAHFSIYLEFRYISIYI